MDSEVVWLPLRPDIRKESYYNEQALIKWISEFEDGANYSYVKEFFAAIDSNTYGWPAPFNEQAVPILLRLLEKYWFSHSQDEFKEALIFRYDALLQHNNENPGDFFYPNSIEETMLASIQDLDVTI